MQKAWEAVSTFGALNGSRWQGGAGAKRRDSRDINVVFSGSRIIDGQSISFGVVDACECILRVEVW